MKILNTQNSFGLMSIFIHWFMAIMIIGLFILGKYMLSLDYYDPFYHTGPWWHKSFGLLVLMLLIFRIIWRIINPRVKPIVTHKRHEKIGSKIVQWMLYLLMVVCCISGVLISTAEDASIDFFNLFQWPAFIAKGEPQAQLAGEIHEYSTLALIIFAALHMLAALKHHFIDKDHTLKRLTTIKN